MTVKVLVSVGDGWSSRGVRVGRTADSIKAKKEEEEEKSLEIPDVLLDTKSEEAAVEYITGCITRKVLIYKKI